MEMKGRGGESLSIRIVRPFQSQDSEATAILSIDRKLFHIKITNHYFVKESPETESAVHVNGYSHSFIPRKTLSCLETIQIDLTRDENQLLMDMHKTTRRQIRSAEERELELVVIETPTNQELKEFQLFYNRFAKNKQTHTCSFFHLKTMKLLRDKNALMLMYMQDKQDTILCYRIYIADGDVVMNLYSASHYRMIDDSERKRILSQANRLLIWKSMLWFKKKGHNLYDMGGLTSDENIRRFKLGFGGEVVPVYSGYEAHSFLGKIILAVRNSKLDVERKNE